MSAEIAIVIFSFACFFAVAFALFSVLRSWARHRRRKR